MTIRTIMVSVDLGAAAADRVQLAAGLAERLRTWLIGVGACRVPSFLPVGDMLAVERIYEDEEQRAREQLEQAKALFERERGGLPRTEWRAALAEPLAYHTEQAREADLVVVGRQGPADGDPGAMAVPTGALLMAVGRPVLVVPPGLEQLGLGCAVVAWKDTREARRALRDALPLLSRAERICIVAVGPDVHHGSAEGAAAYLSGHGLEATTHLLPDPAVGAGDAVLRFAGREGADLLVMGAYGHSRLREWIFGGATRDILQATPVCCLMSH
ncbi:universal stress protein [Methylobacterium sp. R2-1]|uniref:universal stress protein n=1 Tax=Methylobacterium sp. R2-1 TaxID=2587064 RepID=UPI0016104029|nr:universal stress protein [Methylobacterium sp. R2-1]MBB2962573.1 nucleotide-binding universal stress UspA family protein [Methylobacterium sp. R2-1]